MRAAPTLKRAWSVPANRALLVGLASVLPLLLWWLGWFPGLLSSDSVDQFGQARSFDINNTHPAIHTLAMWLITRVWDNPGAISLVQVLALAGVLALAARRLTALGVPWQLAAGSAIAISLLPAVGATTIALWKDVPFTLALVWAFLEVLALARDRRAFWKSPWPLLRLGVALGLVWLFRHNGFLTVVPFLAVLAVWGRAAWRRVAITVATVAVVVVGTNYLLYPLAGVERRAIEPAAVFISDVAASLVHEPHNFSEEELSYLSTIAPLSAWRGSYNCRDSTPLAFGPQFDAGVITSDPGRFQSLIVRTYLRDLDTVLGHRWCAADYLTWPPQSSSAFFHRPPFVMEPNPFGFEFDPISERAQDVTKAVLDWSNEDGRLWLTWRPALVVWLAAATYAAIAWRRRLRVLLLGGALIACQIANVALTTPAQEFRFAFGIYLMGLLSLPLLWLVARPHDASVSDPQGEALRFIGSAAGTP